MEETGTTVFIGDIDPKITETEILQAIRRHLKTKKHLTGTSLCLNEKKQKQMFFLTIEDPLILKNLVIRPILIKGVEHYCQISQKWGETELTDFQKKCIFFSNLPFEVTDDEVEAAFKEIGEIESCYIIKKSGKSKGYGFVYFKNNGITEKLLEIGKIKIFGKNVYLRPYNQKSKETSRRKTQKLERNPISPQENGKQFIPGNVYQQNGFEIPAQQEFLYQFMFQNFILGGIQYPNLLHENNFAPGNALIGDFSFINGADFENRERMAKTPFIGENFKEGVVNVAREIDFKRCHNQVNLRFNR